MSTQLALHVAITIPLAAGLVTLLIPRRLGVVSKWLALAVTALVLCAAIRLYSLRPFSCWQPDWATGPLLGLDGLSALVLVGVAFFSFLLAAYSLGFLTDDGVNPSTYYANFLWVVGSACATALSRDMLVLVFFWAVMGIPFFLLINMGSTGADAAAKKTLIMLGGSDSLLILGVAIIYRVTYAQTGGSFDLWAKHGLPMEGASLVACLCLAVAAFAKAGAIPFHSWLPDAARTAPVPVAALLPASLDKLLGIYLFARISLGLFAITPVVRAAFVVVGAVTVMAAVMMALVQHNLRRLLGFHAVSQVGYMVLGIATGTAVGVIGGLFHMLNNVIYKTCLFLTAGAAERRTGTGELDKMGGLARVMPVTFAAALIAALAISGVPPLNGFVSKWLVYQGVIEMGSEVGPIWVVALVAAMFGSALTLASFVKVLHSVFLGQPARGAAYEGPKPDALMGVAMGALALLCVLFGVFAYSLPIKRLILPALPRQFEASFAEATWQPGVATLLLCVALLVGWLVYAYGTGTRVREDEAYVGGESGAFAEPYRFSGVEFYRTVAKLPSLRVLYRHAEAGWYDIYELGRRLLSWVARPLQASHSGLLLTYVAWCVMGLVVLLWMLLK
jgi:formate hydrogenlyase subunit 3/multisubunit Na+/H+ antiporter MnhD subunit